jgi:hypothetical protein
LAGPVQAWSQGWTPLSMTNRLVRLERVAKRRRLALSLALSLAMRRAGWYVACSSVGVGWVRSLGRQLGRVGAGSRCSGEFSVPED